MFYIYPYKKRVGDQCTVINSKYGVAKSESESANLAEGC